MGTHIDWTTASLISACTGKTILASLVVDECQAQHKSDTCYFYCSGVDPQRNTCISIYRGLLYQAIQKQPAMIPVCYNKMSESGFGNLNNPDIAKQLLSLYFESTPRQFIVIDGLDECELPEIKQVLQFFVQAVAKCDGYDPGKLRVVLTSFFLHEMKKQLDSANILEIKEKDNADDIEAYVKAEVRSLDRYNLEPQVKKDIIDSTCRNTHGTMTMRVKHDSDLTRPRHVLVCASGHGVSSAALQQKGAPPRLRRVYIPACAP